MRPEVNMNVVCIKINMQGAFDDNIWTKMKKVLITSFPKHQNEFNALCIKHVKDGSLRTNMGH